MKTRFSLLLATLCGFASLVQLHAQSTAFTYQGRLTSGGSPANGSHDFQFTLFAAASGGSPLETAVALSAVGVTNGVFTVLLDFGSDTFTGADRWLDIAVRPAGNGAFTPLTPRQPITPTPYAVTALFAKQVPGVSGNALHAADGSPQNAVFVDNDGNVGVGTTSPVTRLHVTTSASANPASPRVESSGTGGFGAGWDFYHGTTGKGYVGVPDSGASFASGELLLFGGPGVPVSLWAGQTRALTVMPDGDVQLGANGQFHAASGEENLRIVRGVVNPQGAIVAGAGFTVSLINSTIFDITFNPPFAGPPAVTATAHQSDPAAYFIATTDGATRSTTRIVLKGGATPFHFIAIGPR